MLLCFKPVLIVRNSFDLEVEYFLSTANRLPYLCETECTITANPVNRILDCFTVLREPVCCIYKSTQHLSLTIRITVFHCMTNWELVLNTLHF